LADLVPYRVLLDEGIKHLKPLFPRKRALTTGDAGLPSNASDARIVRLAWDRQYIIATANGDDFVREINRFQRQMMERNCRDLWGLLVVPDGAISQERVLRKLTDRLIFGGRKITWNDVMNMNLYVRATKAGAPEIRRFRRCLYCVKQEVSDLG
jgi:hypothetical protein